VPEPRRGLVLGAGGVLGAAWTMGALTALAEVRGFEVSDVEIIVGTGAGAVLGSFGARGVLREALTRHQPEMPSPGDPSTADDYQDVKPLPPRPRWGSIGFSRLLSEAARHPRSVPAAVAMSAALPQGRGSLDPIGNLVRGPAGYEPPWPRTPQLWIPATDFETGRRVVFGAPGAPEATVSEAVMASCAVSTWYRPMVINGRRYIDGGTCSATSADLLARLELDEVYVLAPMASFELDCPSSPLARIERQLRRATTRRLQREATKLGAIRTSVTMLAPGPEDLAAIGANMMDPRNRMQVIETSLKTSRAALRHVASDLLVDGLPAAG
jgi:NTE family protein